MVGLHTWATTTTSVILGVAGTILLKLDRSLDEMSTPLRDSMDLVQRVNSLSNLNNWQEYVVSSYDFHSMYTNINWSNVHNAYLFFKGWFQSTPDLTTDLTHGETALLRFLFSQLGKEVWDEHCIHFPFLTIEYEDSLTVGEFLLNVTYTHCIFENPGVGYFRQCLGWAMGTNATPMWSTLVLRYYERLILPLYPSLKLMSFIDDGLLFHPKFSTSSIDLILRTMYPP